MTIRRSRRSSFIPDRMARCELPTLIIHGAEDRIIPLSDSEKLFKACKSADKNLVTIKGAGHNDLFMKGLDKKLRR